MVFIGPLFHTQLTPSMLRTSRFILSQIHSRLSYERYDRKNIKNQLAILLSRKRGTAENVMPIGDACEDVNFLQLDNESYSPVVIAISLEKHKAHNKAARQKSTIVHLSI